MNHTDKLREALEQIANFSDVEMGDGDGARKVALEALAATAAPSEPVVNFVPLHAFAEANRVSYNELCTAVRAAITTQPSAKPAGAASTSPWDFRTDAERAADGAAHAGLSDAADPEAATPEDRNVYEAIADNYFASLPSAKPAGAREARHPAPADAIAHHMRTSEEAIDPCTGGWRAAERFHGITESTPPAAHAGLTDELTEFLNWDGGPQVMRWQAAVRSALTSTPAPVMAVAPEAGGFVRLSKHSDHGKPYRAFTHAQEQARAELAPAIAALIVRDVCETDPADPADPNTVSVNVDVLSEIVSSNLTAPPAPPAAQGAPVMAEAASLETALVTQFGSTTEHDELICAIWAAQPHYFRNREQSLEKARGLLAAATRKGQAE